MNKGIIEVSTGDEIGKLSYSTGNIPFVRSSDISNWELKIDPKQRVSKDIFEGLRDKQDVQEHDILLVRDGTYLIGTTCMITKYNTEMLYQSHIYKIRCLDHEILSPFLLLVILNSPIVKRQIRSKQFTQDIIDTLGNRLMELILPIPKDQTFRNEIEQETKFIIEQRAELRQRTLAVPLKVLKKEKLTEDEEKIIND